MSESTLGSKLVALKEQSGLSLANIARGAGYKNASSIQRYFSEDFDAEFLPSRLAKRLIEALAGYGDPPVLSVDINRLTEFGFTLDRKSSGMTAAMLRRRLFKSVECFGTHPQGDYVGEAEKFQIEDNDPVMQFDWPEPLAGRPVWAIFVSTSSLSPRYDPGEVVFYDTIRPAALGSFVLVLCRDNDGEEPGGAFLARLETLGREVVEFSTLTPPKSFGLSRRLIDAIYPILRNSELLPERHTQKSETA